MDTWPVLCIEGLGLTSGRCDGARAECRARRAACSRGGHHSGAAGAGVDAGAGTCSWGRAADLTNASPRLLDHWHHHLRRAESWSLQDTFLSTDRKAISTVSTSTVYDDLKLKRTYHFIKRPSACATIARKL